MIEKALEEVEDAFAKAEEIVEETPDESGAIDEYSVLHVLILLFTMASGTKRRPIDFPARHFMHHSVEPYGDEDHVPLGPAHWSKPEGPGRSAG